jgi:hypothetical protein
MANLVAISSELAKALLPMPLRDNIYLAADVVVRHGSSLYLVKPMVRRLWLPTGRTACSCSDESDSERQAQWP